jgi:hypothetical protein
MLPLMELLRDNKEHLNLTTLTKKMNTLHVILESQKN